MAIDIPIGQEIEVNKIDFYQYSSEANLNKLLLDNIREFMLTTFHEHIKSATNKKNKIKGYITLSSGQKLPKAELKADLYVECESGRNYIFEIKNPKSGNSSNIEAVGQLLRYGIVFPEATNLVLISTAWHDYLQEIIEKYNLPIDFVLITETQTFLLKKK